MTRRRLLVAGIALVAVTAAAFPLLGGHAGHGTTIEFAVMGGVSSSLGSEGQATERQIAAFEHAHPDIHVKVQSISEDPDEAHQQVSGEFIAGSGRPDVIDSDLTWTAEFAANSWIAPLDTLQPQADRFFPAQVSAGTYAGRLFALPWYSSVEGLYYRSDVVTTAPRSPQQLVQQAQAAMRSGKTSQGFVFEGKRYEGSVTALISVLGGFGGQLDPNNLDTAQNEAALSFLHDAIYRYHISSPSVVQDTEAEVGQAIVGGSAAFGLNWPYLLQSDPKAAAVLRWMAFPNPAGSASAALGGDFLTVNAASAHKAAAWALIQWLESPGQQRMRAVAAGDPPSLRGVYDAALFAQAPYYRDELPVLAFATPRPVTPDYHRLSGIIQVMLQRVLTDQATPAAALREAAWQLRG